MTRLRLLTLALAAVAAVGVVAAACGGSSSEGVAQAGSTETTTKPGSEPADSSTDLTAFAACMRANGVPRFPDPDTSGRLPPPASDSYDPESPQLRSAWRACRALAPGEDDPSPAQQARDLPKLLQFAACMRANGLPKFPDPGPDGGISVDENGGVDANSPQFKAAEQACAELLPGGPPTGPPKPETS